MAASIKSLNLLPEIFRTDPNRKFIAATVDQLTSEPDFKRINGLIGRQFAPTNKSGDYYIQEPTADRQNYQLEPSVVTQDSNTKEVTFYTSYPDLLSKISYNGGITNNHSRLFTGESYNFDGLVDLDKFVNFNNYLWMPDGPPMVVVSANKDVSTLEFTVNRNSAEQAYTFTGAGTDPNPILTLVKGTTYKFQVDQPGNPFWIQTSLGPTGTLPEEATFLSRQIFGLSNNGIETGLITFNVPSSTAQNAEILAVRVAEVDFATTLTYAQIQDNLISSINNIGGIDGPTGAALNGRSIIFLSSSSNSVDWTDRGVFDYKAFDQETPYPAPGQFEYGKTIEPELRYDVFRISVDTTAGGLNNGLVTLVHLTTVLPGQKVFVKAGAKNTGVEFLKTSDGKWTPVSPITSTLTQLYYQDGKSNLFAGTINLIEPGSAVIDVTNDILGKTNYTSGNGIKFTNGLKIQFDNTVIPLAYANNVYIVEGVGTGIQLVNAGTLIVPEAYALEDLLGTPDYITINRSSQDLNAWSRSNRWFHSDLLKLAGEYNNDPTLLLTTAQRAVRPIIEFDPGLYLQDYGQTAKAPVDVLDFSITDAFSQVEGKSSYTIQLPNNVSRELTSGTRIIFGADNDPVVRSQIYRVEFITIETGTQIHLVSQSTNILPTYSVDNVSILENVTVAFVGGNPTVPASANVTVDSVTGTITDIQFSNYGNGYLGEPNVVFVGGGNGTGAELSLTIQNGTIVGYSLVSGGYGYATAPLYGFIPSVAFSRPSPGLETVQTTGTVILEPTSIANVGVQYGGLNYIADPYFEIGSDYTTQATVQSVYSKYNYVDYIRINDPGDLSGGVIVLDTVLSAPETNISNVNVAISSSTVLPVDSSFDFLQSLVTSSTNVSVASDYLVFAPGVTGGTTVTNPNIAIMTGYLSASTMTVTNIQGNISVGMSVVGSGVAGGTKVTSVNTTAFDAFLTNFTANTTSILTVKIVSGYIGIGTQLSATGVTVLSGGDPVALPTGTYVTGQLTGTAGGVGKYNISTYTTYAFGDPNAQTPITFTGVGGTGQYGISIMQALGTSVAPLALGATFNAINISNPASTNIPVGQKLIFKPVVNTLVTATEYYANTVVFQSNLVQVSSALGIGLNWQVFGEGVPLGTTVDNFNVSTNVVTLSDVAFLKNGRSISFKPAGETATVITTSRFSDVIRVDNASAASANMYITGGAPGVNILSMVVATASAYPITITTATPVSVITGDSIIIRGVTGATELNDNTYYVSVDSSGTVLTLYSDSKFNYPLDGRNYQAYTGGGTVSGYTIGYGVKVKQIIDSNTIQLDTEVSVQAGTVLAFIGITATAVTSYTSAIGAFAVTIIDPGAGYKSTPTVDFVYNVPPVTPIDATAVLNDNILAFLKIVDGGKGYQVSEPTVLAPYANTNSVVTNVISQVTAQTSEASPYGVSNTLVFANADAVKYVRPGWLVFLTVEQNQQKVYTDFSRVPYVSASTTGPGYIGPGNTYISYMDVALTTANILTVVSVSENTVVLSGLIDALDADNQPVDLPIDSKIFFSAKNRFFTEGMTADGVPLGEGKNNYLVEIPVIGATTIYLDSVANLQTGMIVSSLEIALPSGLSIVSVNYVKNNIIVSDSVSIPLGTALNVTTVANTVAFLNSAKVLGIQINNPGAGYTSAPVVTIQSSIPPVQKIASCIGGTRLVVDSLDGIVIGMTVTGEYTTDGVGVTTGAQVPMVTNISTVQTGVSSYVYNVDVSVAQPVFAGILVTFTLSTKAIASIASQNTTAFNVTDATPETYEAGDTLLIANPTVGLSSILQTQTGIDTFNQYYFDGTKWIPSQQKKQYNQSPLFDAFDNNDISAGDLTVYTGSKFSGTKIFSYKVGTGTVDTYLGFALSYQNFQNVGDILFVNNYDTDTFSYLKNNLLTTQTVNSLLLKQKTAKGSRYRNMWSKIAEPTKQYQVSTQYFDGITNYFPIDVLPAESKTIPYIKVFVDNKFLSDGYSLVKYGPRHAVAIDPTLLNSSPATKVDILVYSKSVGKDSYYQLPVNMDYNSLNENFSTLTLGQMRQHLISMSTNHYGISGSVLGTNNLRDLSIKTWQGAILQHASPSLYSAAFLGDNGLGFVDAINLAQNEYTKFKNRFLDNALKLRLDSNIPDAVDQLMAFVNLAKNTTMPWYDSDMVPYGSASTITNIPVVDARQTQYHLNMAYDDSELTRRSVLVYLIDHSGELESRQLLKGVDFDFVPSLSAFKLKESVVLNYTTVLRVVDRPSTTGSYVPETPTKLGLYPKFVPMIYVDTTYQTPIVVIQGHDGSITPAFGDIRDQLLLELESRIYNNIKVSYEASLVDIYNVIPGKFRTTDYSVAEFTRLLTLSFLTWSGSTNVNYTDNSTFDVANSWTWNYSTLTDQSGQLLPGFWRGVFKYYYDTDRPHSNPWEMLGLSEQPDWWTNVYGPAPWTGGNQVMWSDLEKGYIAGGPAKGVDLRFVRPGLSKFIPVDEFGNLVPPSNILVSQFNDLGLSNNWAIGDQGPAETAWRRSSAFPYALQQAIALANPSFYFGSLFNVADYNRNPQIDQIMSVSTNQRVTPATFSIPDDGINSGKVTLTAGYVNWVRDYFTSLSVDGTAQITNIIRNLQVKFSYRMAGYSDPDFVTVVADQSSPSTGNNSIVIPAENYKIFVNKSAPINRIVYSAVIVTKTPGGYSVSGYNLTNPYFTVIPSIASSNNYAISAPNIEARVFKDFKPTKVTIPYGYELKTKQQVVDFLVSYGRFLTGQGIVFDTYNSDLASRQDWVLSAKEFLTWSQQGWKNGNIIVLSPVLNKIKLVTNSPAGVIDQVYNSLTKSRILDQTFTVIKTGQCSVLREGNTFALTTIFGQTIALADLNLVQFEHVMLLDNKTVFNDVIYEPALGLRQYRLRLVGSKTANWTGQLNPPGFIYNSGMVDQWEAGQTYGRGSLVSYKNNYYYSTNNVPASQTFNFTQWNLYDKNKLKTGLLTNFAYGAEKFNEIYDIDNPTADNNLNQYSQGITGFRERSYLSDLNLDITSQSKFYQGFIKQKGSLNSITALTSGQFDNITSSISLYEEWGLRVGEYGAVGSNQSIELTLDPKTYTANPATTVLLGKTDTPEVGLINLTEAEVYDFSASPFNPNIISSRSDLVPRIGDLVSAGYPRLDDVDGTIFDITQYQDYKNLIPNVGAGYKLWVGKDFNGSWNVYRADETDVLVKTLSLGLDNQLIISTDYPHGLQALQLIAIKNFNANFDGFYQITSVIDIYTFMVKGYQNLNLLRTQQTVSGTGVLIHMVSVRFNKINQLSGLTPLHGWRDNDKIWVDNDTADNLWAVYQKLNSWPFDRLVELAPGAYQSNDGTADTVKLSADNKYILTGAKNYTTGELTAIRILNPGFLYGTANPVVSAPTAVTESGISIGSTAQLTLSTISGTIFYAVPRVDYTTAVVAPTANVSTANLVTLTTLTGIYEGDTVTGSDGVGNTVPSLTTVRKLFTTNTKILLSNSISWSAGLESTLNFDRTGYDVLPNISVVDSTVVTLSSDIFPMANSFTGPTSVSINTTASADVVASKLMYVSDINSIWIGDVFSGNDSSGNVYSSAAPVYVANVNYGSNLVTLSSSVSWSTTNNSSVTFTRQNILQGDTFYGNDGAGNVYTGTVFSVNPLTNLITLSKFVEFGSGTAITFTRGTSGNVQARLYPTSVASVSVINGGSGFGQAPALVLNGGGGYGATAIATLLNGVINSVQIVTPGSGYTYPPTISLITTNTLGAAAVQLQLHLAPSNIQSLIVAATGTGYANPLLSFSTVGNYGSGGSGNVVVTNRSLYAAGASIRSPGSGYTDPPTILVVDPAGIGAGASIEAIIPTGIVKTFGHSLSENTITQVQNIPQFGIDANEFGYDFDIGTTLAFVGSPGSFNQAGAVLMAKASGTSWNPQQMIYPLDLVDGDRFGETVVVSKDESWLYVGAPGGNKVYVYTQKTTSSQQVVISVDPAGGVNYATPYVNAITAQLNVVGGSGRVFQPNFDFTVVAGIVTFASYATISGETKLYATELYLNTVISSPPVTASNPLPYTIQGVLQTSYVLETTPVEIEQISVAGSNGRLFVGGRDYTLAGNVLTFITTEFTTQASISVSLLPSYYVLVDTLVASDAIQWFDNASYYSHQSIAETVNTYSQLMANSYTVGDLVKVLNTDTTSVYDIYANTKITASPATYSVLKVGKQNANLVSFGSSIATTPTGHQVVVGDPGYINNTLVDTFGNPLVTTDSGKVYIYDRAYQLFIGTGATNTFTTDQPFARVINVFVNGYPVVQGVDFTAGSQSITFVTAPVNGARIQVNVNQFNIIESIENPDPGYQFYFGKSVSISPDHKNVFVGSPGYRNVNYYNGRVYRYINQGLAFGSITGSRINPETIQSDTLRINDIDVVLSASAGSTEQILKDISGKNINGVAVATDGISAIVPSIVLGYGYYSGNVSIVVDPPDQATGRQATVNNIALYANGSISSAQVNDPGAGYTQVPRAYVLGANSSPAEVSVTITGGNLKVYTSSSKVTSIDILPGSGTAIADLGLQIYYPAQIIEHPVTGVPERFGTKVSADSQSGDTLVIASAGAATLKTSTFDKLLTTFDTDTTRFVDTLHNSGAIYVYDYLQIPGDSLTSPSDYLYNQVLQNAYILFGDNFGSSVAINDNWIVAGANESNYYGYKSGLLHLFNNPTGKKGWSKLRLRESKVDIDYINQAFIYDNKTNSIVSTVDYLDPAKGKIIGIADQDIDYKTVYDPATYNFGTRLGITIDSNSPWNHVQLGKVWWNLSLAKVIDYEQGELAYRASHWGEFFPGSIIQILEWIESGVLPSQYSNTNDGTALYPDDSAYVALNFYDEPTGLILTKYYYWVMDKTGVPGPLVSPRTNSIKTIQELIKDPTAQGITYMAAIAPNAISLFNAGSLLIGTQRILKLEYAVTLNQQISHNEYELIQKDNPNSLIPDRIISKLIDSLSGENSVGDPVPDLTVNKNNQLGLSVRPRQSMIKDVNSALKVFVTYVNDFFSNNIVVGYYNLSTLMSAEPVPPNVPGYYNQILSTVDQIGYLVTAELPTGYKVLVESDATYEGYWTIYEWDGIKWTLTRIQSYDSSRYFTYVNWYAPGYDANTQITYIVTLYADIESLSLSVGDIVKVLDNGAGNFEIYVIDADLMPQIVTVENGTLQFSASLYDPSISVVGFDSTGFDDVGFSKTAGIEVRNLISGLFNDIFVNTKQPEINKLFFVMINYILSEQISVDWLFKSSFISVLHQIRKLQEFKSYIVDQQSYYEGYINEVKPYRTILRNYVIDYQGDDQVNGAVSDFDLPAIYDSNHKGFRALSLTTDLHRIQSSASTIDWYNNHAYGIQEIRVVDPGYGYTNAPVVAITGGGGTGAVATAMIDTATGQVIAITVLNSGSGYTSTPTVELMGGNGTGAVAYADFVNSKAVTILTQNKTVRTISTQLSFDRTAYTSRVTKWKSYITYHAGDIIAVPSTATTTYVNLADQSLPLYTTVYKLLKNLPGALTINLNTLNDPTVALKLSNQQLAFELNAVDRLALYNQPGSPDLALLYSSPDTQRLQDASTNNQAISSGNQWNKVIHSIVVPATHEYQYLVVGNRGFLAVSKDGTNWTSVNLNANTINLLDGVFFNRTTWVAIGNQASVFTSTDGLTWTPDPIDTFVSTPSVNDPTGIVTKNSSNVLDFTSVEYINGTRGNYVIVVGNTNNVFVNPYGTSIDIEQKWYNVRPQPGVFGLLNQFMKVSATSFGDVTNIDGTTYTVQLQNSGFFTRTTSGGTVMQQGIILVAGVGGNMFITTFNRLEDQLRGFAGGYNYNSGKNNNRDYPWIPLSVPSNIAGIGDGASGEQISGIAVSSSRWIVAVGSAGTLLWNRFDLPIYVTGGSAEYASDTIGQTIIESGLQVFNDFRTFNASNFIAPLTPSALQTINFTDITWDGSKFVVVGDKSTVIWGTPAAEDAGFIEITNANSSITSSLTGSMSINTPIVFTGPNNATVTMYTNAVSLSGTQRIYVKGLSSSANSVVGANWTVTASHIPSNSMVNQVGKFANFTWQYAKGSGRNINIDYTGTTVNSTTLQVSNPFVGTVLINGQTVSLPGIPTGTPITFFDVTGTKYQEAVAQFINIGTTTLSVESTAAVSNAISLETSADNSALQIGYTTPTTTSVDVNLLWNYYYHDRAIATELNLANLVASITTIMNTLVPPGNSPTYPLAASSSYVTLTLFGSLTSVVSTVNYNISGIQGHLLKDIPALIPGTEYPGVQVSAQAYTDKDKSILGLDTIISSQYTDTGLGVRPEDIIIEGGAYISTYSSYAPEELIPGQLIDSLQMNVFTANVVQGNVDFGNVVAYKILTDHKLPTTYYRLSSAATTILTADLDYQDTEIHVTDATRLPTPNAALNQPGSVWINGELINYFGIDIANNALTNIRRGAGRTSIPLIHRVGSIITDASPTQKIATDTTLTLTTDINVNNGLGNTSTYQSAITSSIYQGKTWLT